MVSQGQITWARMVRADTFYEELGTAIRLRREGLKMTQLDLSERMGLSRTSVTNIERGRQKFLVVHLDARGRKFQVPLSLDRSQEIPRHYLVGHQPSYCRVQVALQFHQYHRLQRP